MIEEERCCGTCRHHNYDESDEGWVCTNTESEYLADWTDYDHTCEEWEERADEQE